MIKYSIFFILIVFFSCILGFVNVAEIINIKEHRIEYLLQDVSVVIDAIKNLLNISLWILIQDAIYTK